jgi:hypothetical protein
MAPVLVWLILILCLLISLVKYTFGADSEVVGSGSYGQEGLCLPTHGGDASFRFELLREFLKRNF